MKKYLLIILLMTISLTVFANSYWVIYCKEKNGEEYMLPHVKKCLGKDKLVKVWDPFNYFPCKKFATDGGAVKGGGYCKTFGE